MLELHQSLHFMLPNHLSWNVQIPSNFSKCSISFPIEPVSLPHHQALLRFQRIKLSKTRMRLISWSRWSKKLADAAVNDECILMVGIYICDVACYWIYYAKFMTSINSANITSTRSVPVYMIYCWEALLSLTTWYTKLKAGIGFFNEQVGQNNLCENIYFE